MSATFAEYLEQSRHSPLYGDMRKYMHVERLGNEEVEGLLDGEVIIQEKLDGANCSIGMSNSKFVIASRNQAISVDGEPSTGFRGLVEYVLTRPGFKEAATKYSWTLRGEWLVRHSLIYNTDAYGHVYIFDVQDANWEYLHPDIYMPILEKLGIKCVPILARLDRPSVETIVELSQGPSWIGPQREGVVVKRYDYRNKFGRTTWGKVVTEDFKTKNKLAFRPARGDSKELRFAALASEQFIIKTLMTIADRRGESPRVQHMGEVLGRVWHDLFTEELWDFVRKERVAAFDFSVARRLVETKARDVALSYYNGVPSIHIKGGISNG